MFKKNKRRFHSVEDIEDSKIASRRFLLKRRRKQMQKVYLWTGIGLFILFNYFIFYSGFFNIKNFEIERNESDYSLVKDEQIKSIFEEQILNRNLIGMSQRNIFVFNEDEFREKLAKQLNINKTDVYKKPNLNLELRTFENYPKLVFIYQERYFYLDDNGDLIRELTEEETLEEFEIPKVFFSSVEPAEDEDLESVEIEADSEIAQDIQSLNKDSQASESGQEAKNLDAKIISADFLISKIDVSRVNFILDIKDSLAKIIPQTKLVSFEFLDPQVSDLRVHTDKGYLIYFDQEIDLERQIENFETILDQKLRNQNFNYIDLRYKDRVYYKE